MRISGFQATATAIQNPFTFYYVNKNDWSSSHSYQFWNKNFTSDPGITNAAITKTIYSPSPSGFVEPKTAAFTGFTSTGGYSKTSSQFNVSGAWTDGWLYYSNGWKSGETLFFNALAFRDSPGSIELASFGPDGNYWTAGASSTSQGYFFVFGLTIIDPQSTYYRSAAFNCRPVKE